MKKPVKDKIKAKAKATKEKVKGKLKGKKKAAVAALLLCLAFAGCLDTAPASRATTASYRIDVTVKVDDGARGNTFNLPFTIGDGALASADSAGSTETQTTTPTMDIKPDIDVAYNDAIKGASDATRDVFSKLTDAGCATLVEWVRGKRSGTVEVPLKSGGTATVKCDGGECEFCTDGSCNPK